MYKEVIDKLIADSMKKGEHVKLSVWRAIKTEFVKFKTSESGVELTDDKEFQILNKMANQRKDSIEQYKNGGREDLAAIEQQEYDLIKSLLPNEPTEDDIDSLISEFAKNSSHNLTMKDMKDIMSFVKTKYPTVNGGVVSKIFKEKYL